MNRLFIFISALTLNCVQLLNAQVSVIANDTAACDSISSLVYLEPQTVYDTITSISWRLSDGTEIGNSDSLDLHLSKPGIYKVDVLINGITKLSSDANFYIYDSPDADFFYEDTTGSSDYTYIFSSIPEETDPHTYSFEWKVDNQVSGNTPQLIYGFPEHGEFAVQLTLWNEAGCSDSIRKIITVTELLRCPNVFTPNMDGFNDYFKVKTEGTISYSFKVFTRSGVKIYHTESPSISWDGRSLSGVEMQPGIYYYIIEAVAGNSTNKINGFIHLIR